MRLTTKSNEQFDLPVDFAFNMRKYNPLLCAAGEQTDPITLPGTPKNLRLIGWSNRFDSLVKPLTDLPVLYSDGTVNRWCNLGIHLPASPEEGISCTLYFSAAEFYGLVGDKKLAALAWPVIKNPDSSYSLYERIRYIIDILKAQYNNPTSTQYAVCVLGTTHQYTYVNGEEKIESLLLLNGFERRQGFIDFDADAPHIANIFSAEYLQSVEDGALVSLPIGYGMTAFLRLNYVLELIFSTYGYTIDMSAMWEIDSGGVSHYMFDSEAAYKRLLLLNNVADAITTGVLNFAQLVPDCTVKEFIAKIEILFAGKFIIDEISRKATFKLYTKQFGMPYDFDITPYLSSTPAIQSSEFVKTYLVDKNNVATKPITEESTSQTLEFDFGRAVQITDTWKGRNNQSIYQLYDIQMNMVQVDDVVHLNTDVVIDGKRTVSDDKAPSDIRLAMLSNGWLTDEIVFNTTKYNVSYRSCGSIMDYAKCTSLYSAYVAFLQNANMEVTANTCIPMNILENMDLAIPKVVAGQKVFIEKIEYESDSKIQKTTFRTLRSLTNRT